MSHDTVSDTEHYSPMENYNIIYVSWETTGIPYPQVFSFLKYISGAYVQLWGKFLRESTYAGWPFS